MRCVIRITLAGSLFLFLLGCRQEHHKSDWVRKVVIEQVNLRTYPSAKTFIELEARLPEFKARGITAIDLMPIFPIGEFNRSSKPGNLYSIRDYYDVNNEFGVFTDIQTLVRSAHSRGIKILIDFVAAYTSWDCIMLMEHPDWYRHNQDDYITSPSAEWNDVAALNLDHHEARKYLLAVMEYWIKTADIDGFRCVDARMVPEDFWEIARTQLDHLKPVMLVSDSTVQSCFAFDTTLSMTSVAR
jgi:glycosidase